MLLDSCFCVYDVFFFFKQKTAYEMRISDWSSDVCSSDLFADALASLLVKIGGMLRQPMHAAMDIGVGLFVEIAFGLYDRQRLLRRGAVIQISQPAPFDRTRQHGEIGNAIQRCRGTGHEYR